MTQEEPASTFKLKPTDLCVDEVGVNLQGTCQLLLDGSTVNVTGSMKLYESTEKTCGDDDLEDSGTFSVNVRANETKSVYGIWNLVNPGVCYTGYIFPIPFACDDEATWYSDEPTVTNLRAD